MDLAEADALIALVGMLARAGEPEAYLQRIAALAGDILGIDHVRIMPADGSDTPPPPPLTLLGDTLAQPALATLSRQTPSIRFLAYAPLWAADGGLLGHFLGFADTARPDQPERAGTLANLANTIAGMMEAQGPRTDNHPSDLAAYDPLTGLANRQMLREKLNTVLATATPDEQVTVMVLNLDGLEPLIDSLGHPQGDRLAQDVADRLRSSVPPSNLLARFAGGGFAVVHAGPPDERAVIGLARRLIRFSAAPFEIGQGRAQFNPCLGIATHNGGATAPDCDQLLRNARVAMGRASAAGGGYRVFESKMGRREERRQALRLDLGSALERDEFRVVYQPLMDLRTGRVASFEALLRWQHPERGMISPAEFIPVAEQAGLIDEIGLWVLRQACRDAAEWDESVGLSVNLSPVQFRAGWLSSAVRQALSDAGLSPRRLDLEITESVLLPDTRANLAVLRELRDMGVRIAMDDFGSGHASLGYLRAFAFDKIKIDQSFVRDIPARHESGAILRAITALARDLGVSTAAEGVENRAQLEKLRDASCDQAQGFLFSRPVPNAEVSALIDNLATA